MCRSAQGHGQGAQAADHAAGRGDRVASELPRIRVGEALNEVAPGNLGFHPSQCCTEAVVYAEAKGEVAAGIVSAYVESIRVGEDARISIGADQHEDDRVALIQALTAGQVDGGEGSAEGELHR